MRVLHVAEILPGGIATYLGEVLPYQATELGPDEVHILVPDSDVDHVPDAPIHVLTYHRRGRDLRSVLALAVAFRRALRSVRPDVVHAHSSIAAGVVRVLGFFIRGRPTIVYCAHGWSFLRDVPRWKNRLAAFVERVLARGCEGISSISFHEYHASIAAGLPTAKSYVIRYGVRPARAPESGPPKITLDPAKLNFFFIGRHDRQKGLDILFDAFRELPPERFQLYVAGSALLGDEAELRPPGNVEYLGWIDHHDVDAYYRAFDALVVPSRWEGFGIVVIEAMRNGIAVVASDRGTLPEIVDDGVSGYIFDLEEPGRLASLLRSLDRPSLARMGASGKERYEAEFRPERMNRETIELYERALTVSER